MASPPERFVLVTGAAGRIGRAFVAAASDRYRFRLSDRDIAGLGDARGHEVLALDVADPDGCRAACTGIDTVVHLAADPSPEADFAGSLLENNIRGAYDIFRAAADAGCRRVIYASSLHAVAGYPIEAAIGPDAPVRPLTMYGVSKCFGEATASYFAEAEGLSCIAVRIGAYEAPWIREEPTRETLSGFISARHEPAPDPMHRGAGPSLRHRSRHLEQSYQARQPGRNASAARLSA